MPEDSILSTKLAAGERTEWNPKPAVYKDIYEEAAGGAKLGNTATAVAQKKIEGSGIGMIVLSTSILALVGASVYSMWYQFCDGKQEELSARQHYERINANEAGLSEADLPLMEQIAQLRRDNFDVLEEFRTYVPPPKKK